MGASDGKKRFRFGLRSLLVVVTLASLLIAMVAQPIFESRKQRRIIAQLETLDANVSIRGKVLRDPSFGQTILTNFFHDFDRDFLYIVDFDGAAFDDEDLALLGQLPYLFSLDLSDTKITDADMDWIAACSNLYELDLSNTQVTDAGILKLKSLQRLAWLKTMGTAVTYDALTQLDKQLPWANSAEQRAIFEIQTFGGQAHGNRRYLHTEDCPGPQYPDVFVPLGGEELFGGDVILGMNRKLKLGQAEISHLAYVESLKVLNIFSIKIEPNSFADLPAIPSLTRLEIWHTDVTDADLQDLARQTQLEEFWMYSSKQVTDKGMAELAKLRNLKSLKIEGCPQITPEAMQYLNQQLPDCEIYYFTRLDGEWRTVAERQNKLTQKSMGIRPLK